MISVGRVILVFPIIWLLLDGQYKTAILLFLIAGISDGVDGFLAKHFHWQSRFGGMVDPLADKFLLVSTYVCLAILQTLPWWFVGLIVLRDLVIVAGAVAYNYRVEQLEADPTLISKLNTLVQILLALLVVVDLAYQNVPAVLITVLFWSVVVTTIASGLVYVVEWTRRARTNRGGDR
ncbi:MAG: CDP-alcohol phosphatidyltransferase family protein [bacterium]